LLPITEIVFLLTMRPPQRIPLRSTYQQMMFQTGFTAKARKSASLREALSSTCGAVGRRTWIHRDCDVGMCKLRRDL